MKRKTSTDRLAPLIELADYHHDPLGFIMVAFPWGEKGSPLERFSGPEPWQVDHLKEIGARLKANPHMPVLEAIGSGHGIGKSADIGMVLNWAMSTHEDTRCVITAGTDTQLRTKTAPEVGKWFRMSITAPLFTITATAIYANDPRNEKSWRADFIPWNEKNPEAFAGLHNQGKRIVLVMDEASQIPPIIWETAEGALTDANTEIFWFARGNRTRNNGKFHECFGRLRHRWITRTIDARTVSFTNKEKIKQWEEDYGEDSDFFRVRVKGEAPRAGDMQFIDGETVENAMAREPQCFLWEPLIMGVDVARYGACQTVIAFRRGRDACTIPWKKYRGIDTMTLAAEVAELSDREGVDAIFIEGAASVGAGVIDRLAKLQRPVFEVIPSGRVGRKDTKIARAYNKRAECWLMMKDWLPRGSIPDDHELETDLTGIEYGYRGADDKIILESKEDMMDRGLASTDVADALALTFAEPVALKSEQTEIVRQEQARKESEYNPYSDAAMGRT
jgi:hypothetical protein